MDVSVNSAEALQLAVNAMMGESLARKSAASAIFRAPGALEHMITEVATITINPEQASAFEAAVARAVPQFRQSPGCHGMRLEREIEDPSRYYLIVRWESVEHHTVTFRQSENFRAWRALVSEFFVTPPMVRHTHSVAAHF